MSPTASHTGRRADDRRGADTRRATEVKRTAQDYERELRRQELAIGRSLTSVLPSDRPARIRELVEARRVLSGAVRDLQRLTRDLEADLARLSAQRSHTQREVLAYEAVAGEIEEVLLRWDARREQLSATIERGNRRQGRGEGRPGARPGAPSGRSAAPSGRPGAPSGRPGAPGGRQSRPGGTQGKGGGTQQGRNAGGQERDAGRDRATGGQGRTANRRQGGGRRGGPPGRSAGGGGRSEPPRSG
jgi:hypothetical protein